MGDMIDRQDLLEYMEANIIVHDELMDKLGLDTTQFLDWAEYFLQLVEYYRQPESARG